MVVQAATTPAFAEDPDEAADADPEEDEAAEEAAEEEDEPATKQAESGVVDEA